MTQQFIPPKYKYEKPQISNELIMITNAFIQRYADWDYRFTKEELVVVMERIQHTCEPSNIGDWIYMKANLLKRKRDFGSMYLNLDHNNQILILKQFRLLDNLDATMTAEMKSFIKKLDSSDPYIQVQLSFDPAPIFIQLMHNLILAFNNLSIQEKYNDEPEHGITGFQIPAHFLPKNKTHRFGNSRYWAKFYIDMPILDRVSVLESLLQYYPIRLIDITL